MSDPFNPDRLTQNDAGFKALAAGEQAQINAARFKKILLVITALGLVGYFAWKNAHE